MQLLRIIWRVMLGSLVVYFALPWFWVLEKRSAESVGPMLLVLAALATLTAVGTFVAREIMLRRPIRSGTLRLSTDEGRAQLMQVCVILWALSESLGLYGLILYGLSGEVKYLNLFLMASAGLFFAHRPGRLLASDEAPVP